MKLRALWKDNGAVAQLGERLPCTQEVRSSILLGSTISNQHQLSHVLVLGAYWLYTPYTRAHIRYVVSKADANISDVSSSLLEFCSLTIQR